MRTSQSRTWGWVGRLGLTLLGLSVLPVILGILLDGRFHTSPFLTLFMMFIGFNIGILTIARSVASVYARTSIPDTPSHPIGGEQ